MKKSIAWKTVAIQRLNNAHLSDPRSWKKSRIKWKQKLLDTARVVLGGSQTNNLMMHPNCLEKQEQVRPQKTRSSKTINIRAEVIEMETK